MTICAVLPLRENNIKICRTLDMTKDKEPQKNEDSLGPDLSAFTVNNFEKEYMNYPPASKLYDYPELHLDVLSPKCYRTIQEQEIKLELYHEETLFYIFYTYTETVVQIEAYNLLISKGYFFSSIYKCFINFDGKKDIDNQNRKIIIFDPFYWKKIEKTVVFDKEFVESIKGRI